MNEDVDNVEEADNDEWDAEVSWFRVGRFEFVYRLTVRVSFPVPRIMCPCYT